MRYASVRDFDISDGEGIGVALFTQGCPFRCKGCFNSETWDFDLGKEYNNDVRDLIISLCNKPYISRFSILGGEPLLKRNKKELIDLCTKIKEIKPDIKIWLYTGNIFENVFKEYKDLFRLIDICIDGQFIESLKDLNLKWRGSSNQRIINVEDYFKTE